MKFLPLPTTIVAILLCTFVAKSQTISYAYDNAGNRISRTIVLASTQQANRANSVQRPDSTVLKENIGDRNITLFPNPTRGALGVNIQGGDPKEKIMIYLYSGNGHQLYSTQAIIGLNTVDMTTFTPGWYILRVVAGNEKREYKIIKE